MAIRFVNNFLFFVPISKKYMKNQIHVFLYPKISKTKYVHKIIKNGPVETAISLIDRGFKGLLITENAVQNGSFLVILRPYFDFGKFIHFFIHVFFIRG